MTFGYEGEETVLDGVDFVVEAGETVALVSATGAGKSTLPKLLLWLYDVDDGAVRVEATTWPCRISGSRSAT